MSINRLWNINNPYQGKAEKVLCVCSAGLLRSPTAAYVLQQEFGYNTRSVGVDTDHALVPIDKVLLSWADIVVVMEPSQAKKVKTFALDWQVDVPKIITLGISDEYEYGSPELEKLILELFKEQFNEYD